MNGLSDLHAITRQQAITSLTAPGQPYELVTTLIDGLKLRVFKNAPRSLRELYADNLSDQTFIVYDDERLSFIQAHREAARIAHLLISDFGVKKGDRVAISMRNYPEWILAFVATTSIGAIAVAMNALWQPDELEYALRDADVKVLFADQERLDRLAKLATPPDVAVIAVRPTEPHSADLRALLARVTSSTMPLADVDAEDVATVFYTSGSTGRPKGVASTHRSVVMALLSWELDSACGALIAGTQPPPPENQFASLLGVPLFHVSGSHSIHLMSYRAQRKLVCMYRWDTTRAAELIERERITFMNAPAAMTGDLLREAQTTKRDLSSLITIGGGGAARAPEQVKQINLSFPGAFPVTGWGMTETNGIGTGIRGTDYLNRPASSGRCSAVLEFKIIDSAGSELPIGTRGELLVRGTSMFVGYWNRPEINEDAFVDGWFRTGDVAYLDDEGYLFIVDRIKDLIIRGGENIGCGQIEAALLMHPDVYEAAVYAVPDDRLGEEIGATVFAAQTLDVEELRTFLRQHLAAFEVPRYISKTTSALPRTASGKISKLELLGKA